MESYNAVPFFQSSDPRLRSAYSYGDPRGGSYPDPTELFAFASEQEESERDEEEPGSDTDYDDTLIPLRENDVGRNDTEFSLEEQNLNDQIDEIAEQVDFEYDEFPSSESDEELNLGTRRQSKGTRGSTRGRGKGRGRGRGGADSGAGNTKKPRKLAKGNLPKRVRPQPRRLEDNIEDVAIGDDTLNRKRKRKRKDPIQSAEFKRINGLVTQAWMREDYDTALENALEAIQLNPEVFPLHATIAEILNKKGRTQDAIGALFAGVHSSREPANWWYVIDRLETLEGDEKEKRQKLGYCYATLVTLNPNDYQARSRRAHLYYDNAHWKRAKNDCEWLLAMDHTDGDIIQLYSKVCIEYDDPETALATFEKFEQLTAHQVQSEKSRMTWGLLAAYLDVLVLVEDFSKALDVCRKSSRKILERKREAYWDKYDDDREWDPYPEPRRLAATEFKLGVYEEETYGLGLPIEFRVRLGVLRIVISEEEDASFQEGLNHLEFLLSTEEEEGLPVEEYSDLYKDAGDCLREAGHHEEALRFYDPLLTVSNVLDSRFYFDIAICYQALGRTHDVRSAIDHIKYGDNNPMAQIGLAKLYQARGRPDLMWRLILELKKKDLDEMILKAGLPLTRPQTVEETEDGEVHVRSKKPTAAAAPKPKPIHRPGPRSKDAAARREAEAIRDVLVKSIYDDLKTVQQRVKEGDMEASDEWLRLAEKLFQEFRNQTRFFGKDRARPYMGDRWALRASRLRANEVSDPSSMENETPTKWRDISLDEWAELLAQYAIALADKQEKKQCWEVITLTERSTVVYPEPHRYRLFRVASLSCAMRLNDEAKVLDECRWFTRNTEFASDAFRLPSSLVRALPQDPQAYKDSAEQKFWLRQVKVMDFSILDDNHRNTYNFSDGNRVKWTESGKYNGNPYQLKELDPELLALYGHQMSVSGSPVAALNYYFRAYALKPDDPMVHLCLGITYIELAFKRQSQNRQYQLQQGLTFVARYYEHRCKGHRARYRQEAEFNTGLIWHTIGLTHLALPAYDRCIQLSKMAKKEAVDSGSLCEDFAIEAALSKRSILATNGDLEGALKLSREWLVL